jgi:hypothetical protein
MERKLQDPKFKARIGESPKDGRDYAMKFFTSSCAFRILAYFFLFGLIILSAGNVLHGSPECGKGVFEQL